MLPEAKECESSRWWGSIQDSKHGEAKGPVYYTVSCVHPGTTGHGSRAALPPPAAADAGEAEGTATAEAASEGAAYRLLLEALGEDSISSQMSSQASLRTLERRDVERTGEVLVDEEGVRPGRSALAWRTTLRGVAAGTLDDLEEARDSFTRHISYALRRSTNLEVAPEVGLASGWYFFASMR